MRSIYTAWERGDYTSANWADRRIEFAFADGPEPGSWKGIGDMSRRYSEWLSSWNDFSAAPEEYIVVDDKRILVLVHNRGRGRISVLALDERSVANFFEIRGGKVIRMEDVSEMLERLVGKVIVVNRNAVVRSAAQDKRPDDSW